MVLSSRSDHLAYKGTPDGALLPVVSTWPLIAHARVATNRVGSLRYQPPLSPLLGKPRRCVCRVDHISTGYNMYLEDE